MTIPGGHAVISPDGVYRYRLDRHVGDGTAAPLVFGYFGVNGSTATAETNDQTVKKWIGFTERAGGSRYIVGNAFAFRARDVKALASAADPIGPENDAYLYEIMTEADILVPCWGSRDKLPPRLHPRLDLVRDLIFSFNKPVQIFGLTASGDPKHPLSLGYDTILRDWNK